MPDDRTQLEPTVAAASQGGWRAWLLGLLANGKSRLGAVGLTLALGFGAGLLSLYLFADVAEDVKAQESMWFDNGVLAWLHQFSSPTLDLLARVVSMLGSELLAVFMVVLLLVLGFKRRWGAVVALLLATVGAQLLNDVLKDLFHRTRPAPVEGLIPSQAFSFPSGHAMVSAAFYLFLAYLAWSALRGRWRYAAASACLLLVLLIGLARLYLGVHYFTDVVAGYLAGFFWTDSIIISGRLLTRRRTRRAPDPTSRATAHPPRHLSSAVTPRG